MYILITLESDWMGHPLTQKVYYGGNLNILCRLGHLRVKLWLKRALQFQHVFDGSRVKSGFSIKLVMAMYSNLFTQYLHPFWHKINLVNMLGRDGPNVLGNCMKFDFFMWVN